MDTGDFGFPLSEQPSAMAPSGEIAYLRGAYL